MLGEFEYLIIASASRLASGAYGASIRKEIEEATGKSCSYGALYTTLDRLELKGLIQTRMGGATAERGGRAKRLVTVTPKGVKAASEFYAVVTRVSRKVAWGRNAPEYSHE